MTNFFASRLAETLQAYFRAVGSYNHEEMRRLATPRARAAYGCISRFFCCGSPFIFLHPL